MGRAPKVIRADFETHGIEPRPNYPPKPVSLALWWPDGKHETLAWGHEGGGNNCTERDARGAWKRARESKFPMLFQNGMFDLDVAETHWDFPLPDFDRWHDTMFLLALWDPHATSFALKPAAEVLLDIPPDEQDRLKEWIIANVPAAHQKPSTWGAYIWKAPYKVVRPYHMGDNTRAGKLFDYLHPRVCDAGMEKAYQRELRLMPILLESSRAGMRVDVNAIERDLPVMEASREKIDVWLRKKLNIENLDSDKQLGNALYDKKLLKSYKWTQGKNAQVSVSKKHLTLEKFVDKRFYHALQYRNQLTTCIDMYARPWLELATASSNGQTLHPNWVQVRSERGGGKTGGARSNRIISTKPNFLAIPKEWKRAISAGYRHPEFIKGLSQLPLMRTYCLPDKGDEWGKRDFNQQELRLFGHFEEGPVAKGFLTGGPKFDIHEDVRAEAEARLQESRLRDTFDRTSAKGCVFGRLYGQGIPGLMEALFLDDDERPVAQIIQKAINTAVPSIKELDGMLKKMARNKEYVPTDEYYAGSGEPIITWGGRLYYCEEPSYNKKFGRDMTYEYKLLNYLLQGSGADVTKETIIRWHGHSKRDARFVVTVYDEINFSSRPKAMGRNQETLKECMLSIETDVPMLSDGEKGPNWGKLVKLAA